MYKTKNFLSGLSRIPIFSLLYPSSQQSQITEECGKNVNLTKRTLKQGFQWFQMYYDTRESEGMSSVTRRNDVIMQTHFVKTQKTLSYNRHKKV
jgi:hypothetical protein